jgi:hypothetical protein
MPPDRPDSVPAPPPPPPGSPPEPRATPPPATTSAVPKGTSPFVWLAIGLIVGVLAGGAGGYFLFRNSTAGSNPTAARSSPTPTVSFTPTATPSSLPSATATPTAPVPAAGIVPCPVATPSGQHTLGSPAPASGTEHADPSLDFCGRGSATIPAGTSRFMTASNWGLGIADSCPPGSAGEGGMNTVLTVSEVLIGGGTGPDSATEPGDWADSGGVLMPTGGNYQLQVTTVSSDCVWHIAIYTT